MERSDPALRPRKEVTAKRSPARSEKSNGGDGVRLAVYYMPALVRWDSGPTPPSRRLLVDSRTAAFISSYRAVAARRSLLHGIVIIAQWRCS